MEGQRKMTVTDYSDWYKDRYGVEPGVEMIKKFCEVNGIEEMLVKEKTAEAIAYFEDAVREADEILDDCTPRLREELAEQKAHFVVALDALRKQAVESAP
jgi:hypothetical protein